MSEHMMNVHEVAEMLGVSEHLVRRIAGRGDGIPAYKIGGCVRFKREEVEQYVSSRAVKQPQRAAPFVRQRFHYVPGMKVV